MSDEHQDVVLLIKKHDYMVKVDVQPYGCRAKFPGRCVFPCCENFESQYVLDYDDKSVEVTNFTGGVNIGRTLLMGPMYAHKALVMFHILRICNNIGYDASLIDFLIHDNSVEENEFLQALTQEDLSLEDAQKEAKLISLAIPALQCNFPPNYHEMAVKEGVSDGFQSIIQLFSKESNEQTEA
jgi:hypothetical protein